MKYKCNFQLKSIIKLTKKNYFFTNIRDRFITMIGPKKYLGAPIPSFAKMDDEGIKNNSNLIPNFTYKNQVFWTPRFYLQKDISREFLFELKKFRKLTQWKNTDTLALTQLVLTEAIRDTTYEITYNYKIEATKYSPFHGTIDILLYNSEKENK